MAYTYYALKVMGQQNKLDDKLYNAWNIDHTLLIDQNEIADFIASQGVDRKQFLKIYTSFFVHTQVEQSKQMTRQYHIDGTPTLIVDGKYVISGLEPEDAIRALDELIAKVRSERSTH
jgi:thiol:disulfide interchange protein DsbA